MAARHEVLSIPLRFNEAGGTIRTPEPGVHSPEPSRTTLPLRSPRRSARELGLSPQLDYDRAKAHIIEAEGTIPARSELGYMPSFNRNGRISRATRELFGEIRMVASRRK